jgi:histone H3/H4
MPKAKKKVKAAELIISKTRTKSAAKSSNVASEFYGALDKRVREIIKGAEMRAKANKRKTLKACDL